MLLLHSLCVCVCVYVCLDTNTDTHTDTDTDTDTYTDTDTNTDGGRVIMGEVSLQKSFPYSRRNAAACNFSSGTEHVALL